MKKIKIELILMFSDEVQGIDLIDVEDALKNYDKDIDKIIDFYEVEE